MVNKPHRRQQKDGQTGNFSNTTMALPQKQLEHWRWPECWVGGGGVWRGEAGRQAGVVSEAGVDGVEGVGVGVCVRPDEAGRLGMEQPVRYTCG